MFLRRPAVNKTFATLSVAVLSATVLAIVPLCCRVACAQEVASAQEYDPKAEAVLQRATDRLKVSPSFSGQVTYTSRYPTRGLSQQPFHSINTFRLQKPNRVYNEFGIEKMGPDGKTRITPTARYVSDGKTGVQLYLRDKTYRVLPTALTDPATATAYGLQFPEFFAPAASDAQQMRDAKASGLLVSLTMAPDEVLDNTACLVVTAKHWFNKAKGASAGYLTTKIYIGKKDGIIRGYHTEAPAQGGGQITDTALTNVVMGDTIPDSVFSVDTTGYKEFVAPTRP